MSIPEEYHCERRDGLMGRDGFNIWILKTTPLLSCIFGCILNNHCSAVSQSDSSHFQNLFFILFGIFSHFDVHSLQTKRRTLYLGACHYLVLTLEFTLWITSLASFLLRSVTSWLSSDPAIPSPMLNHACVC